MKRKMISSEQYMLFFGRQFPLNFAFLVGTNKPFNESRAREVLTQLAKRHPALYAHQAHAEGNQLNLVYEGNAPLLVSQRDTSTAMSREAFILASVGREFNPWTGPLFSLDWRSTGTQTELCFVFHHAVADGLAAIWFIHDFLLLYSGVKTDLPECQELPGLFEGLLEEVHDELMSRPEPEWKKEEPPTPKPAPIPPYTVPDFYLRLFSLDQEGTTQLAACAKKDGLTVNSYLAARVLKASAEIFGPHDRYERTIQCPVDFRQYLKEEYRELAGAYNGIVTVNVDCTLPIKDIGFSIRDGIQEQRAGMKDIEEYFHFRDSFDNVADPEALMMSFSSGPRDYDFSFSNLGRTVLHPSYGDLTLGAVFGPVFTAMNGETVIGLNTTNGVLHMSLIFDKTIEKAESYRELGNKIAEILAEFSHDCENCGDEGTNN